MLDYLLSREDYPIPTEDLEEACWRGREIPSKRLANALSRLNNALEPVGFPWQWRVKHGSIYRDG